MTSEVILVNMLIHMTFISAIRLDFLIYIKHNR